jgi:hypothetical protein
VATGHPFPNGLTGIVRVFDESQSAVFAVNLFGGDDLFAVHENIREVPKVFHVVETVEPGVRPFGVT